MLTLDLIYYCRNKNDQATNLLNKLCCIMGSQWPMSMILTCQIHLHYTWHRYRLIWRIGLMTQCVVEIYVKPKHLLRFNQSNYKKNYMNKAQNWWHQLWKCQDYSDIFLISSVYLNSWWESFSVIRCFWANVPMQGLNMCQIKHFLALTHPFTQRIMWIMPQNDDLNPTEWQDSIEFCHLLLTYSVYINSSWKCFRLICWFGLMSQ